MKIRHFLSTFFSSKSTDCREKGYTLIELILYISVSLIIVGVTALLIRNTSTAFVRNTRLSKLQTVGRDAVLIMGREIRNTGFKTYLTNGGGSLSVTLVAGTFVNDVNDSSSFYFFDASPYDTLRILKATIDASGSYVSTDDIQYFVNSNAELVRKTGGGDLVLARNMEALQFEFKVNNGAWTSTVVQTQKKRVTAIRISLLVRTNQRVDTQLSRTFDLGNVTLSYSDRHLRRLYQETVQVVNNGLFP